MRSVNTLRILKLEGKPRERGVSHGKQIKFLRDEIIHIVLQKKSEIKKMELASRIIEDLLAVVERYTPDFIAEMRGISDASGISFDDLFFSSYSSFIENLCHFKEKFPADCTTWGASDEATKDGKPIAVKNRDKYIEHLLPQIFAYVKPARGYRYFALGNAGDPGVPGCGVNERGLCILSSYVCSSKVGIGLSDSILVKELLEKEETVDGSISLLKSYPNVGQFNLLMADRKGNLAVAELGYKKYAIRSGKSVIVNTNHFVSEHMKGFFEPYRYEPRMVESTYKRFSIIKEALEKALGEIDIEFAKKLMMYHGEDEFSSICVHPREIAVQTLSCFIAKLNEPRVWFTHGNPCDSPFFELKL